MAWTVPREPPLAHASMSAPSCMIDGRLRDQRGAEHLWSETDYGVLRRKSYPRSEGKLTLSLIRYRGAVWRKVGAVHTSARELGV